MNIRARSLALLVLGSVLSLGCGKEKEAAKAKTGEIDAACAKGDQDAARKLMLDGAAANPVFKRAFDGATSGVTDKSRINPCGLVLADLKLRVEHQ